MGVMTMVASTDHDPAYAFSRCPGPVPGTWTVSMTCTHGVTAAYVAAPHLRLPDEGVAILELLIDRHRLERPQCRCVSPRSAR